MNVKLWLIILFVALLVSCEGGLEPVPPIEPGFGGTITFANNWPPLDSLVNLWVFASQIYPLDSTIVFSGLFGQPPRIFVYPTDKDHIALNVNSVSYDFPLPPETYRYVGIVQRFRNDLSVRSFRVVGFYFNPLIPDQPLNVVVRDGQKSVGINMFVDFQNLPPQPF